VLRKIKEAYKFRANKQSDYIALVLFSLFLLFYLVLLYSQMDASIAYDITATVNHTP
jgi:hypothetical protein